MPPTLGGEAWLRESGKDFPDDLVENVTFRKPTLQGGEGYTLRHGSRRRKKVVAASLDWGKAARKIIIPGLSPPQSRGEEVEGLALRTFLTCLIPDRLAHITCIPPPKVRLAAEKQRKSQQVSPQQRVCRVLRGAGRMRAVRVAARVAVCGILASSCRCQLRTRVFAHKDQQPPFCCMACRLSAASRNRRPIPLPWCACVTQREVPHIAKSSEALVPVKMETRCRAGPVPSTSQLWVARLTPPGSIWFLSSTT